MAVARSFGLRARILLVLASVVVSFLVVEAAYRGRLWFDLLRKTANPAYRAYRESLYELDPSFGYRYAPGRDVFYCDIRDGTVGACGTIAVDENGNLESGVRDGHGSVDSAATAPTRRTRVLVFGDSFTANPNQRLGWPHYLAQKSGYEVMNFARDGYGLMQMFDLAAARVSEFKPDFIIIAFIPEDLWRDRTWRATVSRRDGPVTIVATDPEAIGDPGAPELALVDPEITPAWCERLRSGGRRDRILERLNRRYRDIGMRQQRTFLLDIGHSLVLNRLRHGDPFSGLRMPTLLPITKLTTFEDDPRFMEDVRSIHVPVLLVVLPRYEEILGGRLIGSPQGISLLESLTRVIGSQAVLLMKHLDTSGVDVKSWYLLPDDQHPSPAGSEAFAEAIWRYVEPRVTALEKAADAGPGTVGR